ncbi:hypothetical protein [Mycobacterium sp.]|uniref:hypothetical protein n=1 Tax=Mycobacterium sp. TaxID=1785 RepID=UPI0025E3BE19|nr:hypothetical protein [Mycobacterium sp.]
MASNGPPNDFQDQRTRYAEYGVGEQQETPPGQPEPPESLDPFDQATEPTPWYRKPVGLIAWLIVVLILIGLIVYGVMDLIHGGEGTSPAPSSTTPTTSATTAPPTTTESPAPPPTSTPVESPAQQPTQGPTQQPTRQPTQQPPTHRHHLPSLPSVINVPGMPAITLPPGMPDY